MVMIPLTLCPPSKSFPVCLGSQGGYHASNRWDIVVQPIRSVTVLRGTLIYRGAGGPGRMLFIPFVPPGLHTRMLTVELEALTELMHLVQLMPASVVAMEEAKEKEQVEGAEKEKEEVATVE